MPKPFHILVHKPDKEEKAFLRKIRKAGESFDNELSDSIKKNPNKTRSFHLSKMLKNPENIPKILTKSDPLGWAVHISDIKRISKIIEKDPSQKNKCMDLYKKAAINLKGCLMINLETSSRAVNRLNRAGSSYYSSIRRGLIDLSACESEDNLAVLKEIVQRNNNKVPKWKSSLEHLRKKTTIPKDLDEMLERHDLWSMNEDSMDELLEEMDAQYENLFLKKRKRKK